MKIPLTELVVFVIKVVVLVNTSYGGGYCRPAYSYSYYRQPYYAKTYAVPQVKVVNQLVGIPVAVPYVAPIAEQGKTQYGYHTLQSYQFSKPFDFSLAFTQGNRLIIA